MKRESFYRRDPGLALAGMASMTLEQRGVYNTVIDLLYLTWRPLEDKPSYIAGHCGCAVQKLNPILAQLIAMGKLIRFEERGQSFISNDKFEDERLAVKGIAKTRSGQPEVGEKSAGVEEKSPGVGKNPPTCEEKVSENQNVIPLEKSRVDQTIGKEPPIPPGGEDNFKLALKAYPPQGLENVGEERLWKAWCAATASIAPEALLAAVRAFAESEYIKRQGRPKRFDRWLLSGAYAAHAGPRPTIREWLGPPDVRAAIVAKAGEEWTGAWLDRCAWRDLPDRAIVSPSPTTVKRLKDEVGDLLSDLGISIWLEASA